MKIRRVSDQFVRNFKMRIMHLSDTHGRFPRLYGRFDVVLHTGDLFPNSHHVGSNKNAEMGFQLQWLRDSIPEMKAQLQGHPLLYVPGNHDFLHSSLMEFELRAAGLDNVFDLTDKLFTFRGVNFYGFPYVPAINGMWNYEREIPEMEKEVDKMVEACNKTHVDVLACHAPVYKCLDLSMGNQILGSTVIANALDYKIARDMQPTHYLCGHIHEAHGTAVRNGMLFSNAATTQQIIEI
jgi:Icc-related predicted phosphoesterase